MKKQLTFVLGAGGARGALQIGALRALYEAGYRPDLMVGTSAGAVNATYLALHGYNEQGLEQLERAWLKAAQEDLLPPRYLELTLRVIFGKPASVYSNRMKEFFIAQGLSPDLRYQDLTGFRLVTVAADLNSGKPVLHGIDPNHSVLEGLLASTAIPPWITPRRNNGQLLVDGGALSCLPIEAALALGASEIIAMSLGDVRGHLSRPDGLTSFFFKYVTAIENRQTELELALAVARKIPVRSLYLAPPEPVPLWDFKRSQELMECGYELARQTISTWPVERRSFWSRVFPARPLVSQDQ